MQKTLSDIQVSIYLFYLSFEASSDFIICLFIWYRYVCTKNPRMIREKYFRLIRE